MWTGPVLRHLSFQMSTSSILGPHDRLVWARVLESDQPISGERVINLGTDGFDIIVGGTGPDGQLRKLLNRIGGFEVDQMLLDCFVSGETWRSCCLGSFTGGALTT